MPSFLRPAAASVWRTARREILLTGRPLVMGILNVTPDSFSDGAKFCDPVKAVEQAFVMADAGADLLDIGGESTRPGAQPVPVDEELRRIMPVLEALAAANFPLPVSVDTYKAAVAAAALQCGAEIINDISGLTFDMALAPLVAEYRAGIVLMHTRGRPAAMQQDTSYQDLTDEVLGAIRHSLALATEAGVSAEQVVVDPGIGFGKSATGNLELLRALPRLAQLGRPVLLGTSRKSFIGTLLGRSVDERLAGTLATLVYGYLHGAMLFRVHDVRPARDALDMAACLTGNLTV